MVEIILGILLLIIGFILIVIITDAKYPFYTFSACFFMVIGTGIGLILGYNKSEPTALDVYRGKTTLEITYKDGIAIDSVVVFKNK